MLYLALLILVAQIKNMQNPKILEIFIINNTVFENVTLLIK